MGLELGLYLCLVGGGEKDFCAIDASNAREAAAFMSGAIAVVGVARLRAWAPLDSMAGAIAQAISWVVVWLELGL